MANTKENELEDVYKKIMDKHSENVRESDWYDEIRPEPIWVSSTEQKDIDREQTSVEVQEQMKKIIDQFRYQQVTLKPQDPIDRLRDEMHEELKDIKKAIHTIGILLDGDKPGDEILKKHKTLRDAYRKYKMIEALILGQQ